MRTRRELKREGTTDMTDEHVKGAISKALGKVEEGLGKLTGDKKRQARGKACLLYTSPSPRD